MELPVLYRNNIRAIIGLAVLLIAVYFLVRPKTIPPVWINSNDQHLTRSNGFLYYNNKIFSGWIFSDYENGNRERQTPYYEGKEEGVMKSWYTDKAPEQERLFVYGKKEGIHRGWWPNGKPKFEYQFTADEHNGTAKEWFGNAKLYRCFHYVNGHEEGLQQMWWADGSVRANYVVKNGEQFGLIGRKLCKNVFENEDLKNSSPAYANYYGLP